MAEGPPLLEFITPELIICERIGGVVKTVITNADRRRAIKLDLLPFLKRRAVVFERWATAFVAAVHEGYANT